MKLPRLFVLWINSYLEKHHGSALKFCFIYKIWYNNKR